MSEKPTVPAAESGGLLDQHRARLDRLGISDQVRSDRGYRSVTDPTELKGLDFAHSQHNVPSLLLPTHGVGGDIVLHQIRPDCPRQLASGTAKYEVPWQSKLPLDVPPRCREKLGDKSEALFVVEGILQADAGASHGLCCINTLGAGIHPGSNKKDEQNLLSLADWDRIELGGRDVCLAFSSSVTGDRKCFGAVRRLARFLDKRGANVKIIKLQPNENGDNVGLDDFLVGGGSVEELISLAEDYEPDRTYFEQDGGIWWRQVTKDDVKERRLTRNFTAKIICDMTVTDGVEERREFQVEAIVDGVRHEITLTPKQFLQMDWHLDLGAGACIEPEWGFKERTRAAIQVLSGDIPKKLVRTHLGWFEHGGVRKFAHAGGVITPGRSAKALSCAQATPPAADTAPASSSTEAVTATPTGVGAVSEKEKGLQPSQGTRHKSPIEKALDTAGPNGPVSGGIDELPVEVRPPAGLEDFVLPKPPRGKRRKRAILASMQLLKLQPPEVMFPLFASIYRAPLGPTPYSPWLDGPTGCHKLVRAALAQQHYGQEMNWENLPTGWNSTSNALAAMSFRAKDVLLTVDDWLIRGTAGDMASANRDADRLLRAQANRTARRRCAGDGSLRPSKPPRALIVSTAEAAVEGHSLNARLVRLDCSGSKLTSDDAQKLLLDACQIAAEQGYLAESMAGYIEWLAPRFDRVVAEVDEQRRGFRKVFAAECDHPRTAMIMADLTAAFEVFLDYADHFGVINGEEFNQLWDECWKVLCSVAKDQQRQLKTLDPAMQFVELIGAALLTGKAHVTNLIGEPPPEDPLAWGWSERTTWHEATKYNEGKKQPEPPKFAYEDHDQEECTRRWPRGDHIGYCDYQGVYLIPDAALAVAQRLARAGGWTLPIRKAQLGHVLHAKGLLVDTDTNRKKLTVRINVTGARPDVYYLAHESIMRKPFYECEALEKDWEGPTLYELLA